MAVVKAGYWHADASDGKADSIECNCFAHLFCGFAKIDPATYSLMPLSTNMTKFSTTVKQKNSSVRTFLSIGGDPATLSAMASSANSRETFIKSAIEKANTYDFDGLDLAWKCPTTQSDMKNLGDLVSDCRQKMQTQNLLLTAALYYHPEAPQYPLAVMQQNLDWINVMAFDFVNPKLVQQTTAGPAALNSNPHPYEENCVKTMVDSLLTGDPPLEPKKLVLGLAFYGYGWILKDEKEHGIGAKAEGPAFLPDGFITLRNIMQEKEFNREYDKTVGTDFAWWGTTWVGYDGIQSIWAKVSYAKTKSQLRGYVIVNVDWDTDDAQHAKEGKTKAHSYLRFFIVYLFYPINFVPFYIWIFPLVICIFTKV